MKYFTFFLMLVVLMGGIYTPRVEARDFSEDTIYFIVVDRFKDGDTSNNPKGKIFSPDKKEWKLYWGGDIQGIIDELTYIRRLGCSAVWITPVVENTEDLYLYGKNKEEKISAYHGYWGKDFYRINPFFSDMKKFREFIEKAHGMDIKIIFDYVLNHSSPIDQGIDGAVYKEGKFIADYSNDPHKWFHHNGSTDFRKKDPREWQDKNLFDLADFNSENPDVQNYIFNAAKDWMNTGIDAFRIDTVRHIPVEFAAEFYKEMKKNNRNIFIFGEWSMGGPDVPGAVDFTRKTGINMIDFTFTFKITDVLCKKKSFKILANHFKHDGNLREPQLMVTCIDNHDMPRFISTAIGNGADLKTAKRRTELALYILLTSRGIPCIYYGTEQFLHVDKKSTWGYGGEPYNRQMMSKWNTESKFFKNIGRLAEMRRETKAISRGSQDTLFVSDEAWVYERRYKNDVVMVAVNKGRSTKIKVNSTHLPDGTYDNKNYGKESVMGTSITVKDMQTQIELGENDIGIWRSRKTEIGKWK